MLKLYEWKVNILVIQWCTVNMCKLGKLRGYGIMLAYYLVSDNSGRRVACTYGSYKYKDITRSELCDKSF